MYSDFIESSVADRATRQKEHMPKTDYLKSIVLANLASAYDTKSVLVIFMLRIRSRADKDSTLEVVHSGLSRSSYNQIIGIHYKYKILRSILRKPETARSSDESSLSHGTGSCPR